MGFQVSLGEGWRFMYRIAESDLSGLLVIVANIWVNSKQHGFLIIVSELKFLNPGALAL